MFSIIDNLFILIIIIIINYFFLKMKMIPYLSIDQEKKNGTIWICTTNLNVLPCMLPSSIRYSGLCGLFEDHASIGFMQP